tara:strand:+ start:1609 stop:3786 length:2178 start_codon:yes stop_codon:yes gene_type:complete
MNILQRKMFANGNVVQDAPLIDVASEIANYSKIGLSPIEIFERLQQDYAAIGMEMPRDLGMLTIERIAQQVGGTMKEDAQIDSVNFPELGGDGGLGESPYNLIPEISPERLPPVDSNLDPRLGTYQQGGSNLNPAEMPPLNTNIDIDSLLDEAQNEIKIEDDLPTKVETLGPNDVRLSDGRIVDFTKGIQDIKEGKGKGLELYRIFNSPDVERGANVDEALSQFVREDEPGFFKIVGSLGGETPEERRGGAFGPEDFGSGIVAGVKGALDVGREGLERTVPGFLEFFGGEKLGNKARDFLEGEFDEGYVARGGFNPSVIDNIVINASGSSISEDLEEIGITNETGSVVKPEVGEPEFVLDDGPEGRVGFESKKDLDDYRNSDEYKNWIEKPLDEDDFISSVESRTVAPGNEISTRIVDAIKTGGTPLKTEEDGKKPKSPSNYSSGKSRETNFAQFTQSPDFIRFVRNLGKGLVSTGEIGKGIALGSAAAAEEKSLDEKKEAETYAKFLKDQAEANKVSDSTYKDVTEASVKLNQDVRDYNNALAAQVLAQSVIDFANGDANLASFTNKIGATVADVVGGFTGELDDPSKLSSTRRAQIALEILTNRNIKEILGESGRTISNIDRDIAKRVVGSLDNLKLDTVAAIKIKLNDNIGSIIQKRNEAQRNIKSRTLYISRYSPELIDEEIATIFFKDFATPLDQFISSQGKSSGGYDSSITFVDAVTPK